VADRALAGFGGTRRSIPFTAVNHRNRPGHDPSLQRHHLLPRQLRTMRCFERMFAELGIMRMGLEDFRRNGMLLPARERAAVRTGLPLHRGPHRTYSELVAQRVGQIERGWAAARPRNPESAVREALMRLALLQRGLRRRLLDTRRRLVLNRRDPIGDGFDFTAMDAMTEALWSATQPTTLAASSSRAA
jgi:hypothetical protein